MYVRDVEAALSAAAKNRYWREGDAELVLSLWRDVGLRGGRRVVARPGFDEATLVRVIRVLEDLAC